MIGKAREEGQKLVEAHLKCVAKIEQLRELMEEEEKKPKDEEPERQEEIHETVVADEEEA